MENEKGKWKMRVEAVEPKKERKVILLMPVKTTGSSLTGASTRKIDSIVLEDLDPRAGDATCTEATTSRHLRTKQKIKGKN